MSWTQQNEYWRRPLDCHDRLFQHIAAAGQPLGREHWLMIGTAQLVLPHMDAECEKEKRLRQAWAALRLRHPDIAIELHHQEKRYVPVTHAESLSEWAEKTFKVETTVTSADELFSRRLRFTEASATCYWIPSSSELGIVASHWQWDGRGLLMMLHEFLDVLTTHNFDGATPVSCQSTSSEVARLVPSLDALMNVPDTPSKECLSQAEAMLAPVKAEPASIGLPIKTGSLPGDTSRLDTILSHEETAALLAACRVRGTRLTAALHASIIVETARAQSQERPAESLYKSWAAFDLRKYCPPPFDGPAHAPSLRMVALPLVVDASADWDTLLTLLQPVYRQSFAPEDGELMMVRVPYVEKATALLAEAVPTTEPNLSNVGTLDNYVRAEYGDIRVNNVWLAVHMLSPQLYVHAWSWKRQLHLSVCYNESFYDAAFVEQWVANVKMNLFVNLSIKVPVQHSKEMR
ncbi:hypothetical protein F4804DRAFT_337219 [Jackrogersella minutella]|nr:hypothetical protein F4804DRAFT_337219 [Jackrogersella minutella]